MKLEGTVTVVDNIGSPDTLLVTVTYSFEIIQQRRRYVTTVPLRKSDVPDALWPPRIGDRLDLNFDPATITRPTP